MEDWKIRRTENKFMKVLIWADVSDKKKKKRGQETWSNEYFPYLMPSVLCTAT